MRERSLDPTRVVVGQKPARGFLMSKIVLMCFKHRNQKAHFQAGMEILSSRLAPDNISPNPPEVVDDNGVLIGILNPVESLWINKGSACLGYLIDPKDNWWRPMAEVPDGAFALFRSDENVVELASDVVASRTIWYVQTDDVFIASTSQRAIVHFLREFKPDKTAFLWMLSSGTLGPDASWDSRIQRLGPNARLVLDRSRWKLRVEHESIDFDPLDLPVEEHRARLQNALKDTFDRFEPDHRKWILLLSGGYDSRGVLLSLKDRQKYKCITWGLESSLLDKRNDAYISKSLAEHFDLDHQYFAMDVSSDEPLPTIFDRFLVAGEGRIDHIAGYMDGFEIWKQIFEMGYSGVIRGDHGFGWKPRRSISNLRCSIGAALFSDYHNLKSPAEVALGNMGTQTWPKHLQQREGESLALWSSRLQHEYVIPTVLAALNDLKCAYVEVANPLLSRRIITQVRGMSDHLLAGKSLWKKVVGSMVPQMSFAENSATQEPEDILKQGQIVDLISNELDTAYAKQVLLSDEFVDNILRNMTTVDSSHKKPGRMRTMRKLIRDSVPRSVKNVLRNALPSTEFDLDYNRLGFRAYIICRMHKILSADARAF